MQLGKPVSDTTQCTQVASTQYWKGLTLWERLLSSHARGQGLDPHMGGVTLRGPQGLMRRECGSASSVSGWGYSFVTIARQEFSDTACDVFGTYRLLRFRRRRLLRGIRPLAGRAPGFSHICLLTKYPLVGWSTVQRYFAIGCHGSPMVASR